MASWIRLSLLIYLGFFSTVEGAQLTITPQPITAGETSPVIITCRLGNIISQVMSLYKIAVLKYVTDPKNENKLTIAEADSLQNNGAAKLLDNSLSQRATVSGKADNNNKQGSFVQVSLTSMSCQDSGSYYCEISYNSVNGKSEKPIHNVNITVQSNPSNIVMVVHPRKEASPYYLNETVEFQCKGNVGFPPKAWSWEWKYADSMTRFTSYPYTQRIKDDPPTTSGCSSNGGTTLNHIVTMDDNARMFRCLVDNKELYSDNFTIYTQTQTTVRPGGAREEEESSAHIGYIVGGTLGALAVLAIVIVLIYFLWYRRRNSGENYKTDEENKHPSTQEVPPDQMHANPTYDAYPQYPTREEPKGFRNKKKGEVNPAMDEPRNRHNSSQDDMSPHNYHNTGYAEDGGAMPMGSAV